MIAENPFDAPDQQPADPATETTPTAPAPARQPEPTSPRPQADRVAVAVEAILFATDTPLTSAKIAQVAGSVGQSAVTKAIAALNERYDQMGAAFYIKAIAGGYRMQTRPQYDEVISRLHEDRRDHKLSQASMETLAIIAYRQPILRADIEAIRGVSCGEVLRNLMDKQLAKIVGRANVLGRPMLYGTTRKFLEVFGLAKLEDLPNVDELKGGAPQATAGVDDSSLDEQTEDTSDPEGQQ